MAKRTEAWRDDSDQSWNFRGSSFGGCMHSVVLALMGKQPKSPEPWLQARFAAGTKSEDYLKQDLMAAGLATAGGPDVDNPQVGVLWDSGAHYTQQRRVESCYSVSKHFRGMGQYSGLQTLRSKNPDVPLYKVACSLDGWGLEPRRFLRGCYASGLFKEGVAVDRLPFPSLIPFVLEHKSMNEEKKRELDACCVTGGPNPGYLLNPMKFAEFMHNYSWQISAQHMGMQSMCIDAFSQPNGLYKPLDDIRTAIFLTVETLAFENKEYKPTGRYIYYLHSPPRSDLEIAERLHEAVTLAGRGEVPPCDSEYQCNWTEDTPLPARRYRD